MKCVAVWFLVTGLLASACSGEDEPPTAAEVQQRIRDEGAYCCTHNGAAQSSDTRCRSVPGRTQYLPDFSNVDESGRGDACGWVLTQ